jgi:hypothetical protein
MSKPATASKAPKPWQRSTRAHPCPVCHAADCLATGPYSDPAAVVCRKVQSTQAVGVVGWLHVLRSDGPAWPPWRFSLSRIARQGGPR